jgi:hypothetical protein
MDNLLEKDFVPAVLARGVAVFSLAGLKASMSDERQAT